MKKIIIIAAVLCVAVLACSLALQSKNEKTAAPLSAAAPLAQSSAKSADKPKDKAAGAIIHIAEPGDVITLGSFPQTGFSRKQPLRWRVLETFYTEKALIIAENAVECMPFQAEPKEQSSWQDSENTIAKTMERHLENTDNLMINGFKRWGHTGPHL